MTDPLASPDPSSATDPTTTQPDPGAASGAPTPSTVSDTTVDQLADQLTDTSGSSSAPATGGPSSTDSAVLRYGKVLVIGTAGNVGKVQTDATGAAWIVYDASYTPTVGDLVYLLQQGPVAHIGGKLGGTQPTSPPVGVIHPYAGSTPPTGWLQCNGAAVSRTTYAALFAVCGTTYGAGDGSSTFNLPNLTDRVPTGSGTLFARGETGGAKTFTMTSAQMPAHVHGSGGGHTHTSAAHVHGSGGGHTHGSGGGHTHTGPSHTHGSGGGHTHGSGGPHNHGSAGTHSHTIHIGPGTVKAVTGGTGNFWYNNPTTADATTASAGAHTHSDTDPGPTASTDPGPTAAGGASATASTDPGPTASTDPGNTASTTPGVGGSTDPGNTASTGGGGSVNNMPPYLGVIFIVRALA